MAFIEIIIAVAYFLQVCFAQVNNGQTFNPNLKLNTFGGSEKSLQSVTDNANFRGNYINFAANHLSQSQSSQNRLSDFFSQKAAAPLENNKNTIFSPNSNQKQLSNIRQQINVETQDLSTQSNLWNTRQDPNLGNNIHFTPSNELPLTSNILPAPNIAGNTFLVSNIPNTQSIIPPSLTISTSLPPFIPKVFPNSYYNKLQPTHQVSHDTNANKVFLALAEPIEVNTNTNPGNYYYVPPKPGANANSQKSLNMKSLLPLIINLLNDKNQDCPCCSNCRRCNNKHNLAEIPLIDSGYSKQKTYGSPSDESYEDSESEEEINDVERKNAKFNKNRDRKRKYHRHHLSREDEESQSAEH